ncbi:MAG: cbb3-type cytochrome oxidase assembly protein CcoS [Magnetococcales bacterium]|nr:cbb3-type cytochrome oxidase assembly protein CcoS [Magnetococcales bacterium]MBF0262835.1 cbb3-type cytochrome oxidase assembly protein CcoS [Magnetococcales bacterium]
MNAIFILLPIAVLLSLVGLGMLIWSVRKGQFDDLEGPAHRILFEDDQAMIPESRKKGESDPRETAPPTEESPD